MGQVAFDTLKFVETLEGAGLPKDQAKAISLAVRESHEAVDVATKADITEVKRDIADVRKDMAARFEKNEAQIADVRKDLSAEIADVRKDLSAEIADVRKDLSAEIADVRKDLSAEMNLRFEKTDGQIALIRKDVETIATGLLLKLGGVIVVTISAATAILKFF
ncbi:coiled-coil domain-containing protein [Arsenophonus endosymbiont of Crataerina pallida]|uniref:coiled-coil domain-containing protein n=1 Tax=Arsenophonus endosymbiont of Crataerina pallida TaxID=3066235 RepID=UPI0030CF66DD